MSTMGVFRSSIISIKKYSEHKGNGMKGSTTNIFDMTNMGW